MITMPQAPALSAIVNAPAMIRSETPVTTIPGRRKASTTPVFGKATGQDRTKTHNAICAAIREYIRRQGGWCEKFSGGGFNPPGIPDLLACLPTSGLRGVLVAIEVKTGAAVLNANQERMKAKMGAADAIWITAHSLDEVEACLVAAGLAQPCLV